MDNSFRSSRASFRRYKTVQFRIRDISVHRKRERDALNALSCYFTIKGIERRHVEMSSCCPSIGSRSDSPQVSTELKYGFTIEGNPEPVVHFPIRYFCTDHNDVFHMIHGI